MNIYVDNSIISGIVRHDWDKKFNDEIAWERIRDHELVNMVVSSVTYKEINGADSEIKKDLLKIADGFKCIQLPTLSYGNVPFGQSRGSTQDPSLTQLRKIFTPLVKKDSAPKLENARGKALTNDADHIYRAYSSGCDYFLTVDRKAIKRYLKNQKKVKNYIGKMEIIDPPALWNLLDS